jgi:hypothetical protein
MVNFCRKVTVKVEEAGPLPVEITAPWSSSQRISQQATSAWRDRVRPWDQGITETDPGKNHGRTMEKTWGVS